LSRCRIRHPANVAPIVVLWHSVLFGSTEPPETGVDTIELPAGVGTRGGHRDAAQAFDDHIHPRGQIRMGAVGDSGAIG
jgi:hypothetical protein